MYACLVKTASKALVSLGAMLISLGAIAAVATPAVSRPETHELLQHDQSEYSAAVLTRVARARQSRDAYNADGSADQYQFKVAAGNEDAVGNLTGIARLRALLASYRKVGIKIRAAAVAFMLLSVVFLVRLGYLHKRYCRATRAERERIARDIHDTLLQGVQALLFRLQVWEDDAQVPEFLRVEIASVARQTESIVLEGRERILTMRRENAPLGDLAEALGVLGQEATDARKPAFAVNLIGEPKALTADAEAQLLDIAREAVRNACLHANATRIAVTLEYRRRSLKMMISDDGRGFDPAVERAKPMHFGLMGMRERARQLGAQFRVRSSRHVGTRVEVAAPARTAFAATRRWPWQRRSTCSKDTASLQPTKSSWAARTSIRGQYLRR